MYTDEEVERCYEEFYEDVHTEFLKYGEIVNFKVCRNGAFHLRGNLYVHYKSLDSAVMAYHSMNGRYFAGKQVKCEFVGVTRWKIAICGEYMKSRLKTCSRGTACNFIHCFRNPGGDYEWADWDKPPPRYWMNKMTALFGYSDESGYDKQMEQENFSQHSRKMLSADRDRYHFRRSRSRERERSNGRSSKSRYEEDDVQKRAHRHELSSSDGRKQRRTLDEKNSKEPNSKNSKHGNIRTCDTDSDGDCLDRDKNGEAFHDRTRKSSRQRHSEVQNLREYHGGSTNRTHETESDRDNSDCDTDRHRDRCHDRKRKTSRDRKKLTERRGDPLDRTVVRDKDWSDLDRDGETHHDRTRKHKRHRHSYVTEYPEYHGGSNSRTYETDSDGDLSDGDRKREGDHVHKRRSSRKMREVSDVQNDFGNSTNRSNVTDFDGDRLHEDRDSQRDGRSQRRGSKSQKKVSEIHDDSRDNKNGAHVTDSHVSLLIEDRYRPED